VHVGALTVKKPPPRRDRLCGPEHGYDQRMTNDLPTARTVLRQDAWLCLLVWCTRGPAGDRGCWSRRCAAEGPEVPLHHIAAAGGAGRVPEPRSGPLAPAANPAGCRP